MYDALDELLIHSTQWNYTASNRNDPWIGDGWNQEDLSIYSPDQIGNDSGPDAGGRAIDGFSRPYVHAAQGAIMTMHFDSDAAIFTTLIAVDPAVTAPTEIYLPARRYGASPTVECDGAKVEIDGQIVRVSEAGSAMLTIRITR